MLITNRTVFDLMHAKKHAYNKKNAFHFMQKVFKNKILTSFSENTAKSFS